MWAADSAMSQNIARSKNVVTREIEGEHFHANVKFPFCTGQNVRDEQIDFRRHSYKEGSITAALSNRQLNRSCHVISSGCGTLATRIFGCTRVSKLAVFAVVSGKLGLRWDVAQPRILGSLLRHKFNI